VWAIGVVARFIEHRGGEQMKKIVIRKTASVKLTAACPGGYTAFSL
jgi:hypothetical protein